jgi:hypothetical protein
MAIIMTNTTMKIGRVLSGLCRAAVMPESTDVRASHERSTQVVTAVAITAAKFPVTFFACSQRRRLDERGTGLARLGSERN